MAVDWRFFAQGLELVIGNAVDEVVRVVEVDVGKSSCASVRCRHTNLLRRRAVDAEKLRDRGLENRRWRSTASGPRGSLPTTVSSSWTLAK